MPVQLHGLAEFLKATFGVSVRRVGRLLRFNLSVYFYWHRWPDQAALVMLLKKLEATRVRYGYLRLYAPRSGDDWVELNDKRE